ncbi:signal peptidase I [Xylanimonas ulmi]|uniref:signal peptidase I n=1 Tax=Xylanimonas ulmi TaxID=228973 RepID=UPI0013EEA664|nr:signal peptidase I [Xylanibacterium ulmi]
MATLAVVAALWPAQWGGFLSLTIVSGPSMTPAYQSGDLVIGLRREANMGDVVVYRPDGIEASVVHRVVSGDTDSGWVTRGDHNDWDDPWLATSENTLGVVQWRLPHVSRFVPSGGMLPIGMACLIGAVLLMPGREVTTVTTSSDEVDDAAEYHI